jgi:MYXO-CTERM domain-containing protein
MAHAARNPLFLAALSEAEKDHPGAGDFCLRCHAPEAWLEGRCFPTDGSALLPDDGGVGCAVCHRMDPSPWKRNGQYLIGEDIDYRGPYPDAMAPHRWKQGGWIGSSELCGACHDLYNPLVMRRDLDGTPMNMRFPEQTTYTEWATSSVSVSKGCKDCHLPEIEGPIAEGAQVRSDRSSHELSGGNLFLLGAIDFLEPGLGIAEQLERGKARIEAQLRRAATLELDAPIEVSRGEPIELVLRVTNETGHKLPTGYPEGRRVWLELASDELSIERGAFDEVTGEPIDPLAIYHVKQGQLGIGPGHRLVLNDAIFVDTRIPPAGMIVTATTAPVGKTYPEVEPGILAHWDVVAVTATTPCDMTIDQVRVRAVLWYQSVTKSYVDALVAENGADPRGLRLRAAFDEADPGPTEMAAIERNVSIREGSTCGPPDAGAADAGFTDAGGMDAGVELPDGGVTMPEQTGCGCAATGPADGAGWVALILVVLAARKRR